MNTHTKHIGDFIKVEGADWGAYWDGKQWVRFQCFGCAYAQGYLQGKRLSNGDFKTVKVGPGAKNKIGHDVQVHNQWLRDGKPKGAKRS